MTDIKSILDTMYFGNSVQNYTLALFFLLGGLIFHVPLSSLIIRAVAKMYSKSENSLTYKEMANHLKRPLKFLILLIFVFFALHNIDIPESLNLASVEEFGLKRIALRFYQLLIAYAVTRVALKIVVIFGEILKKKADKTASKQDDQLIPFAIEVAKIILIIIAILIVFSTIFELNVGSLVAGLGIGGLAIALAAKESLENLLGSFSIFFDKPFVVGDLVKVGSVEGIVEKVGFRSTRIRTLEKSYLTIPNKKMIDAELDNLSLRTFRRVKFNIGLTYGTNSSTMKSVVDKIKKFLDEHEHTNQDAQVRFMDFGSSSLDIMILYYIDTMDWNRYLEYKEEINYKIMEIVEECKGDFAFPTQTIHLQSNQS